FYSQDRALRPAAELNVPTAFSEFIRQRGPFEPAAGSTFEHVIRTKQSVHLADAAAEGQFFSNNSARLCGARAPPWPCRCSRRTSRSAQSPFIARRYDRSATDRSSLSAISRSRPSSP